MPAILILILFGILQGLTEFLPVSSSGHLSLFQYFAKSMDEDLSLNVAVHIGTLFTILFYYRKDILFILSGVLKKEKEAIQMVLLMGVASVPTAIIGLLMKKKAGWILTNPVVASACLLITGAFLLWSDKLKVHHGNQKGFGIDFRKALMIGTVQGFAVLPGISRSGSTIVSGLALGMTPTNASRFSFLISLPAIAGAGLLEFKDIEGGVDLNRLFIGGIVSFVTGLIAISWMVQLTQKNQLKYFAYYVIAISVAFLAVYSLGWGHNAL